eukprot:scaffold21578_cov101-Isochrysis_galbana.AAC.4
MRRENAGSAMSHCCAARPVQHRSNSTRAASSTETPSAALCSGSQSHCSTSDGSVSPAVESRSAAATTAALASVSSSSAPEIAIDGEWLASTIQGRAAASSMTSKPSEKARPVELAKAGLPASRTPRPPVRATPWKAVAWACAKAGAMAAMVSPTSRVMCRHASAESIPTRSMSRHRAGRPCLLDLPWASWLMDELDRCIRVSCWLEAETGCHV